MNIIDAKGGDDIIFAGGGDDVIIGNLIFGQEGDILRGDEADDIAASYFIDDYFIDPSVNPMMWQILIMSVIRVTVSIRR